MHIWTCMSGCRSAFWKKQQLGIPGLLCGVPVNVRMFSIILMLHVYNKYTILGKRTCLYLVRTFCALKPWLDNHCLCGRKAGGPAMEQFRKESHYCFAGIAVGIRETPDSSLIANSDTYCGLNAAVSHASLCSQEPTFHRVLFSSLPRVLSFISFLLSFCWYHSSLFFPSLFFLMSQDILNVSRPT